MPRLPFLRLRAHLKVSNLFSSERRFFDILPPKKGMTEIMKTLFPAMAIAAAVLVGGCTTVEISSPNTLKGIDVKGAGGKADRAIMLGNEGYYLFQCFPIVSGDVTWDAKKGGIVDNIAFFSDELAGDRMANAMFRYAESQNCDLVDLVINNRAECKIGLFGLMDWFNTIVGCQSVCYSGVLRPRK